MVEAEFVCPCGFQFRERFLDSEVSLESDLESFYVRCPRCGEEAHPRSLQWAVDQQPRRRDES